MEADLGKYFMEYIPSDIDDYITSMEDEDMHILMENKGRNVILIPY